MFNRLFASMVHSSIWSEPSDVCKVWITLLALRDRRGYVFASVAGVSRIANLPVLSVEQAIATFLAPDPYSADLSRVPEQEGRRIEVVDGGWRLLNADYYDKLAGAEDRRVQVREAVRRHRANVIKRNHPKASVSKTNTLEVEVEVEVEVKKGSPALFAELWNRHRGPLTECKALSPKRRAAIRARWKDVPDSARWAGAIKRLAASAFAGGDNDRGWIADVDFILRPDTLMHIEEGRYDNRVRTKTAAPQGPSYQELKP